MVDINTGNSANLLPSMAKSADMPQPQDAETAKPKRKPSAGEVIFNRVVYTGIGFGVNEASSLWITNQFMHGKNLLSSAPAPLQKIGGWFSKAGFERASEFIAKTFKMGEKIAKDGTKILPKARGGNALLMATLLSGGTLLVLPMKWLENHKTYWVKKANHLADSFSGTKKTEEEVAARDAEVEQAIACSPKQSWPALLLGRTIAMFSSWATGTFLVGPERNKKIMEGSEHLLTGAAKAVGLGGLAKSETFKRYAQLTGIETYSCALSSMVLEFTSKLFAKRGTRVHDPELCRAVAADQADVPAAPTGSSDNTDTRQRSEPQRREFPLPVPHSEKIMVEKEMASGNTRMAL